MVEEQSQSQAGETQVAEQPGPLQADQVAGAGADVQPGAEEQPQARTYSEAEWKAQQDAFGAERAARDKALSSSHALLARQAMETQVERAERKFQAEDQQAVEYGELTQEEARRRPQQRYAEWQQAVREQQLDAREDALGRAAAAQDYGKEFGVDPQLLLDNKALGDPGEMKKYAKTLSQMSARERALDKREKALKGNENYDSGQLGSLGGLTVDKMSPEEKIQYGLNQRPRRRS